MPEIMVFWKIVDGHATQCISERMQNRRLRNGQTFTGARAFSRQTRFSVLLK